LLSAAALALLAATGGRPAPSFGRGDAAPVVVIAGAWPAIRLPLLPDIAQIIKTTAKPTITAGTMIA
jgi:hypothetical protein